MLLNLKHKVRSLFDIRPHLDKVVQSEPRATSICRWTHHHRPDLLVSHTQLLLFFFFVLLHQVYQRSNVLLSADDLSLKPLELLALLFVFFVISVQFVL